MKLTCTILLLLIGLLGFSQTSDKRSYTYINAAQNLPGFTDINQVKAHVYLGTNHKEYQLSGSMIKGIHLGLQYYQGRGNISYKELNLGHFAEIAETWFIDFSAGYGVGEINPGEYTHSKHKQRILYGTYDITTWNYNIDVDYERYYFQASTYIVAAPNTKLGLSLRATKVHYSKYDYKLLKKSEFTPTVYIDDEVSATDLSGIIFYPAIFLITGTKHIQFNLQIGESIDRFNSIAVNSADLSKQHPLFHRIFINTGLTISY